MSKALDDLWAEGVKIGEANLKEAQMELEALKKKNQMELEALKKKNQMKLEALKKKNQMELEAKKELKGLKLQTQKKQKQLEAARKKARKLEEDYQGAVEYLLKRGQSVHYVSQILNRSENWVRKVAKGRGVTLVRGRMVQT